MELCSYLWFQNDYHARISIIQFVLINHINRYRSTKFQQNICVFLENSEDCQQKIVDSYHAAAYMLKCGS